jgi:hypothetical protein
LVGHPQLRKHLSAQQGQPVVAQWKDLTASFGKDGKLFMNKVRYTSSAQERKSSL